MQSAHKSMDELLNQRAQLIVDSNRVMREFLMVDLELSLTFAKTALLSDCDAERKRRNRRNARRGYESVLSFVESERFEIEPSVRNQLREKLEEVRECLASLGEVVPPPRKR